MRKQIQRLQVGIFLSWVMVSVGISVAVWAENLERRPGFICPAQYSQGSWTEGRSHFNVERTEAGFYMRYSTRRPTRISKVENGDLYLAFDHKEKSDRVQLVGEPGPGTIWNIVELPRVKNSGGFGYKIFTRISPATGPTRDHYLTQVQGELRLAPEGPPAKIYAYIDDLDDGK